MTPEDYEKFMGKIRIVVDDYGDEHMIWIGTRHTSGKGIYYPIGGTGSESDKMLANRMWFWHVNGYLPEAVNVYCGNGKCVSHVRPRNSRTEAQRARKRETSKRAIMGHRHHTDNSDVSAHLTWLTEVHGMSDRQISLAAKVSCTTVTYVRTRTRKTVTAPVRQRLMAVQPKVSRGLAGGQVPALPTARRLRALVADGFSPQWQSDSMGVLSRDNVGRICRRGEELQVLTSTARTVAAFYDKMQGVKSEDLHFPMRTRVACKVMASRGDFPPRHCWDEDTIDDMEAIPEWTGACGTAWGYQIHIRERHQFRRPNKTGKMLEYGACEPCTTAKVAQDKSARDKKRARRKLRKSQEGE